MRFLLAHCCSRGGGEGEGRHHYTERVLGRLRWRRQSADSHQPLGVVPSWGARGRCLRPPPSKPLAKHPRSEAEGATPPHPSPCKRRSGHRALDEPNRRASSEAPLAPEARGAQLTPNKRGTERPQWRNPRDRCAAAVGCLLRKPTLSAACEGGGRGYEGVGGRGKYFPSPLPPRNQAAVRLSKGISRPRRDARPAGNDPRTKAM